MKDWVPSFEHSFSDLGQTTKEHGSLYRIRVNNGPTIITHVLRKDLARLEEAAAMDLQINCTPTGKYFRAYRKDRLTNGVIIKRIVQMLAFELPGTFEVEIFVPNFVTFNTVEIPRKQGKRKKVYAEELKIGVVIDIKVKAVTR